MTSWNIEKTATEANDDFLLTHEELIAIFMQHVSTSSNYYTEILDAFKAELDNIDLGAWNRRARTRIKNGERALTFDIILDVDVSGVTTNIPVTVTTNIDVTVTEGGSVTNYVIDHEIKINGELITNDQRSTVQYAVDEITGTLDSWFEDVTDPVTNPKEGDYLEIDLNGNYLVGELVDDPEDPTLQAGRSYQLWAVASNSEIEAGDHMNTFLREPLGFNVTAGAGFNMISSNRMALDLLVKPVDYTGAAIIDFGTQRVVVVDSI